MKQILYQLDEYIKYNKMENSKIHETLKNAFVTGYFKNIYLDTKTYPILKQQIFKLMHEYCKVTGNSFSKIQPWFW